MKIQIRQFADGCGVLIPEDLLAACGFGKEATLTVRDKTVVLAPAMRQARAGWAEALRAVPDEVLRADMQEMTPFGEAPSAWDAVEWSWPESAPHEKM